MCDPPALYPTIIVVFVGGIEHTENITTSFGSRDFPLVKRVGKVQMLLLFKILYYK